MPESVEMGRVVSQAKGDLSDLLRALEKYYPHSVTVREEHAALQRSAAQAARQQGYDRLALELEERAGQRLAQPPPFVVPPDLPDYQERAELEAAMAADGWRWAEEVEDAGDCAPMVCFQREDEHYAYSRCYGLFPDGLWMHCPDDERRWLLAANPLGEPGT